MRPVIWPCRMLRGGCNTTMPEISRGTPTPARAIATYDGENRMITAQGGISSALQYYSYDGDGRRVKRIVENVETWQVYGIGGELIAEYAANTAASSPQKEYGYRNGQMLITATVASAGWVQHQIMPARIL